MTDEQKAREIVAFEVGWIEMCGFKFQPSAIEAMEKRFASALAAERERCAKVADSERRSEEEWMHHYIKVNDTARHFKAMGGAAASLEIAREIRALGNGPREGGIER